MGLIFESVLWDAATVISIIGTFLYYYLTSTHDFWRRLNVPYIEPRLFYGNMKDVALFKKTQVETLLEFYSHFKQSGFRFGGIFHLRDPVLLICCPELARDIFTKNFPHFHDRHFVHDENFDPLSAHLVSLEGQKWKFIRSRLSPAFSASKLKGMLPIIRELADEYMKTLGEAAEKEDAVEMRKSCSLYLMDVIGAIAFGLRVNAQKEESEFLHVGKRFFEPTKWERISQMVLNTYPWLYKTFKIKTISKDVTKFFIGVVKDTIEHRRRNNVQKNDFLHFLMKIREEKGINLNELEEMKGVTEYNMAVDENSIELTEGVIAAQAFVFFLAGYETSSSALSTCAHLLAHYPEIQEKILREVESVIQKFGDLTYEAIQNLTYVEQVLEETLRMYPPVGLILRKCTKSYLIPGTETVIPEGCKVFIPVYSFHYDPEYFPNPKTFDPERFSPENRKNLVPYTFMPFGHGPRVCIGYYCRVLCGRRILQLESSVSSVLPFIGIVFQNVLSGKRCSPPLSQIRFKTSFSQQPLKMPMDGSRLAMMEMKMSLALLIKHFKFLKCEKTTPFKIDPKCFFMTPVDGLWVKLIKRN